MAVQGSQETAEVSPGQPASACCRTQAGEAGHSNARDPGGPAGRGLRAAPGPSGNCKSACVSRGARHTEALTSQRCSPEPEPWLEWHRGSPSREATPLKVRLSHLGARETGRPSSPPRPWGSRGCLKSPTCPGTARWYLVVVSPPTRYHRGSPQRYLSRRKMGNVPNIQL